MRKRHSSISTLCLLAIVAFFSSPWPAAGAGVAETKHNLSAAGPGTIKSLNTFEICIFCHTPHKSRAGVTYLWNRYESTAEYIPYQSSTLQAAVGQPTGASKLCLSCHDGTVALGMVVSRDEELAFQWQKPGNEPLAIRFMPVGSAGYIGTDLSASHPVSFKYDATLVGKNQDLVDPTTLVGAVRLDATEQLQCTACHDPHDNTFGKFMVMSNQNSLLCTQCHALPLWPNSAHATSTKLWNGVGIDPWPPGSYPTVTENGCASCHKTHGAGSAERLLRFADEENNCLSCHNGNVAQKNIAAELNKVSVHGVQDYLGLHDPTEDFSISSAQTPLKHVECGDCHNAHRANNDPAPPALGEPPLVSGATAKVTGITSGGSPLHDAVYSYEICFKCHGDTNFVTVYPVTRQIDQLNTRLEFSPGNPSFHPVVEKRLNPEVPSLVFPLTDQSRMSCIDCHSNDDPTGPRGPHGSNNPYLLARTYERGVGIEGTNIESAEAYALCYSCHDRTNLLSVNSSFPSHYSHVVTQETPCSVCHDPHGISSTQGNAINNSNLINFDLDIVLPDSQGRLMFEDQGTFTGQCFLNCHGAAHEAKSY